MIRMNTQLYSEYINDPKNNRKKSGQVTITARNGTGTRKGSMLFRIGTKKRKHISFQNESENTLITEVQHLSSRAQETRKQTITLQELLIQHS